ncbi:MAG: InlB B-repeat-containing protein [Clostridia bacterium]|nr:InlB B-repeat-containing protein [Clostridia bacterium]
MNTVFTEILDMSMTASFMIAAVILIRPLARRVSKNINCILWALVGLRLILPFSFKTKVSAVPDIQSYTSEVIPEVVPQAPVTPTAPTEPVVQSMPIDIVSILRIIWLCGMAALLVYAIVSYILLKLKTDVSIHDTDNIYICDNIKGAFIMGGLNPRIYLPSDTPDWQKEHVIAHERAHMKRLDYLWKPLGFCIAIVHWFNPLAWVAYILLCRDIELACDEAVTRNMSIESKKAYTLALLKCAIPGNRYTPAPLSFGEVGVKERIRSVLNYKKPAFWLTFGVTLLCIVATVMFMTDPMGSSAKEPEPDIPEVIVNDTEDTSDDTEPIPEDTTGVSDTESADTTEPEETEPEDTEPIETEPVETEPKETEPAETKPIETKPAETKPVETEPADTTTSKPQKDPEPTVVTHTVTFVANGGYCEKTVETVTHGQSSVILPMPTRAGYIFEGWWDSPEGGTRMKHNTVCTTADTVLYAHWRKNNTVNIRLMYDGNVVTLTLTKGSSFGTLFTPEKEGYTFDGWYLNGSERVYPDTPVPDYDVHLEARWTEN